MLARVSSRTFSGIQPTGHLHLGNYLGAVRRWVQQIEDQKQAQRQNNIFCVVDLHAITLPKKPQELRQNVREMTAGLLACGLSPTKCVLFKQSMVQEHTELAWVLSTLCSVARLNNMATFKEKSAKLKETPLGLFLYPVLQAADILLYKATEIPVGEDNLQNLELAQHLQQKFNRVFSPDKDYFPRPEPRLPDNTAARVKSLRDPQKKMSKSDLDQKSCIYLSDPEDVLASKIRACVTDSIKEVYYDPVDRPGVSNLIVIHSELTGADPAEVGAQLQAEGMNKMQLKSLVTRTLVDHLRPIREEMERLLRDPEHLDSCLSEGQEAAQAIARETMGDVRRLVGLTSV